MVVLAFVCISSVFADYRPPAGQKPAVRGQNGAAILPGGQVIQPTGVQIPTGPNPARLVASPSGRRFATANLDPQHSSLTIIDRDRKEEWSLKNIPVTLSGGIAFAGEKSLWIAEGENGKVQLLDVETGSRKRSLDLNQGSAHGSYAGDLAYDPIRSSLLVTDRAHDRVVVFDTRDARGVQPVAEIPVSADPRVICLAPNGKEAYAVGRDSISVIDLSEGASARVASSILVENAGGILATESAVFVSDPVDDSVSVIDPATKKRRMTVQLRIPGLESLRGIRPMGMAYDPSKQRLLVAEAGLNAIAIIDVAGDINGRVLGHVPVGWFPTSVLYANGTALVANARGRGTGPSSVWLQTDDLEFEGIFRRGSVSRLGLPSGAELEKSTRLVLATNGLLPLPERSYPAVPIHHVVIVLKGSRTFDDVMGDVKIPGSVVAGLPDLARFGNKGYADGRRKRFSLQEIAVTPNHHALALGFTFSDNFYAGPDDFTEGLAEHLKGNHKEFLDFGEAFDGKTSDQSRVSRFISELDEKYKNPGKAFPEVILIRLPNDKTATPHPLGGYPYAASYAADNDFALGRVVDYFSHSPWWHDMAIFVTEADAQDGRDHIDSHRTVFIGVGPWFRKGYCSHVNANLAAILKLTFRWLDVPAMHLADASAADLQDMLTTEPNDSPFVALPVDPRLFDASEVR